MLTPFLNAWNDPAMRHAMVAHFPIVLSILGLVFAAAAVLIKDKTRAMRWSALAIYLALAVTAFVAAGSGENAEDALRGSLAEEAQALVHEHEELGEKVWPMATAVCVLLAVALASNPKLRLPSAWLAVVGALVIAGWVANTAEHGGRLVYEHGAGTPDRIAELLGRDPSAEPTEDARVAFFRQEIQPLLVARCLRCHNPGRAERSGSLDQTTIAGLLAGGKSGPALVPGRPDESLLIELVRATDPETHMPPGDTRLSDEQITALERWIAEGAVWEPFEFRVPED
jgi:uncharacterized membrane protein